MKRFYPFLIALLFMFSLIWLSVVNAAVPLNDSWMNPETFDLTGLPFTDNESGNTEATGELLDPFLLCREGTLGSGSDGGHNTVWYQFTTGSAVSGIEYYDLSTAGSSYNTVIGVFTGTPGDFRMVTGGCNDNGDPGGTG